MKSGSESYPIETPISKNMSLMQRNEKSRKFGGKNKTRMTPRKLSRRSSR